MNYIVAMATKEITQLFKLVAETAIMAHFELISNMS